MRTRSQPLSPGGAVSLEKEPPLRPATRQTRSMRAQSTEATAKSGSSQTQSSVEQQVSEESSQPAATGKKNASASGKTAAAKKTKTTKQTTTSTKKSSTTTAAKKSAPGRKAPTTKKTNADEKPSSKRSRAPAKRTTQTTTERRTTRRTATKSPEGDLENRTPASTSPEAAESDARATNSPTGNEDENLTLTEAESSTADVLLEPNSSKCESPKPPCPSRSQGTQEPQEPQVFPGQETPKDGPGSVDFASLSLEQFSDIGSPLSVLSGTPSVDLDESFQTLDLDLSAEMDDEPSPSSPAVPARASSPNSLQIRGQPCDPLEPVPTEGPLPMDLSLEWSEAMDKLTLSMGNLCLADPVVDVASASMFGNGRLASSMAFPSGRPLVEEPQFRSTTRAARVTVPISLSPVPEEPEQMELDNPSPVKVRVISTRHLQETEVDPIPLGPCSLEAPMGRCQRPRKQKQTRPQEVKQQRLTSTPVNRKRARAESVEEVHETPQAKRRSVRAPVSTSLSRRLLPLSRRLSSTSVPYTERLRRRQAERQGRIHTTVFRLPELVAQNEADRRASESHQPTSPTPCPPAPERSFDSPETPGPSRTMEEQPSLQEPRTPETPSGWNIRGLLSSVPRSFSRFLPRFGRSQEEAGGSDQGNQMFVFGQSGADASHKSPPSTPSVSAPSKQPSSEHIQRASRSVQVPGGRRILTPRTAPTKKPELSYDLFPRPIDRSLYLPSESSSTETNEARKGSQKGLEKEKQAPTPSKAIAAPSEERAVRETDDTQAKKRKRSPSPDVIPNPPGCSYGMDLRYFCYSSDSEDEDETPTTAAKPTPLQKSAARSELENEQHPSKRVRFDASPEDTPSKKRGRATDPYHGRHFLSPGEIPSPSGPDTTAASPPSPASPSPTTANAGSTPAQRRPGFIPNTQGTFGIDYDDDSSSESSSSEPSTPASVASPASNLFEQQTPRPQSQSQDSLQSPRATPRQAPGAPSTPSAKADNEALAKVRSQAEKYKPKTPSGLRTASRFSSSPMVASPDVAPTPSAELEKSMSEYSGSDKENAPTPADTSATTPEADKFGDDQFARDAEWLYEHCPSGDFNEFAWPSRRDLIEALGVEPEAGKVSTNAKDLENGPSLFNEDMAEFAAAFA